MRRGFGLIGLVFTAIVLVVVGVIAYNVGWSDGVNTHLPAVTNGTAAAPYYYGYGPHWGFGGPIFGILGFLWFLFVLFIIFAIFRFLFFGRRMWGGGGWGYGPRGWHGGMPQGLDDRMQEWHRKAHEGQQPPSAGSGTPPPPPPDSRSV